MAPRGKLAEAAPGDSMKAKNVSPFISAMATSLGTSSPPGAGSNDHDSEFSIYAVFFVA